MTVTVRGFGILETSGANTSTHVVPTPSDNQLGDLFVCLLSWLTVQTLTSVPEGFQHIRDAAESNVRATCYIKRTNNNEPADYTFVHTNTGQMVGAIIALKDAGAIDAYDIDSGQSLEPTCPDVTTSVPCFVLRMYACQGADGNLAGGDDTGFPAGTTGIFARTATGATDASRKTAGAAFERQTVAGATGTSLFSIDTNRNWVAITLCIDSVAVQQAADTTTDDLNRRRRTYVR